MKQGARSGKRAAALSQQTPAAQGEDPLSATAAATASPLDTSSTPRVKSTSSRLTAVRSQKVRVRIFKNDGQSTRPGAPGHICLVQDEQTLMDEAAELFQFQAAGVRWYSVGGKRVTWANIVEAASKSKNPTKVVAAKYREKFKR